MLFAFATVLSGEPAPAMKPTTASYAVSHVFHLGGEGSYWDYVTTDPDHGLVYVSRGSHMMVLTGADGAVVADIRGQDRNHGVALVPSIGRGFISDGDDGSVVIFDLHSYKVLGKIRVELDADAIAYDADNDRILLTSGDAKSLTFFSPGIDPHAGQPEGTVALGGKPGFLVVEGGKAYINITDLNQVAVVDTKTMKIVDHWSSAPGGEPVALGIDRVHRRLFVGCCNPQKMVVMSLDDGRVISNFPIGAGVDAVQFDGDVFAACRDGTLTVGRETSPGTFERIQSVRTKPWAGTMGLDPRTHRIYLPAAEFAQPPTVKVRTAVIPDSFVLMVVTQLAK